MRRLLIPALILLCACLLLAACDKNNNTQQETADPTDSGSNTTAPITVTEDPDGNQIPIQDAVAFYVGEEPVYNYEFNFHVVSEVNAFAASEEGIEAGFDPNLPLSEQYYPGYEETMEELFKEKVIADLQSSVAFYLESKANGYIPGEQEIADIESFISSVLAYAASEGWTEEEFYLYSYGVEMTREQLHSLLERNIIGTAYKNQVLDGLEFEENVIEEFYEKNKMSAGVPEVNVVALRVLNFANKQMGLDVLEKFEQGDRSEESFTELVKTYTMYDEDIETGGLYPDVGPVNQRIEYFDQVEQWTFDSERKHGDYKFFETEADYRLVFFVDVGEPLWRLWSIYMLQNEALRNIVNQYPVSYPEYE